MRRTKVCLFPQNIIMRNLMSFGERHTFVRNWIFSPLIFESIKVFISTKQFRKIRTYYLLLYMRFIFRVMIIQVELIFRSLYMHGVGILLYLNYKEISDGILFRGKLSSSVGRDYLHRAFQNMALILVGSHFPRRVAIWAGLQILSSPLIMWHRHQHAEAHLLCCGEFQGIVNDYSWRGKLG